MRRVLSHTAGLPLHYAFFYEGSGYPARSADEGIRRYGILVNPAGAAHEYSNLGYGVLERIIENVTGRSYDFDHRGGSAMYASVTDLIRFGQAHLPRPAASGPRLLSEVSLAEMQRIWTTESLTRGYGLGWSIVEDDGGYRRVSHTGGMPGVTTALYLFPTSTWSSPSPPTPATVGRWRSPSRRPPRCCRAMRTRCWSSGTGGWGQMSVAFPPIVNDRVPRRSRVGEES